MRIGRRVDFRIPIAVEVGDRQVLVVHAGAIAGVGLVPRRPAGTHTAVGGEHVDLLGGDAGGIADDDLEPAVRIEIGQRERAHFAAGKCADRPAAAHTAIGVVHRHLRAAAADHDTDAAVVREVADRHARPDAIVACGAPLQRTVDTVERDHIVGPGDDIRMPVAVQVGHGRRAVPAGLAPRREAAAVGPLQHRRLYRGVHRSRRHRKQQHEPEQVLHGGSGYQIAPIVALLRCDGRDGDVKLRALAGPACNDPPTMAAARSLRDHRRTAR